jgi:hypothetical protein
MPNIYPLQFTSTNLMVPTPFNSGILANLVPGQAPYQRAMAPLGFLYVRFFGNHVHALALSITTAVATRRYTLYL